MTGTGQDAAVNADAVAQNADATANADATETNADAETFADAEADAGTDAESDAGAAAAWATGGTASMSGNYPDPFAGGIGNVCALTCSAILGPCYVATIERMDISEGVNGLPIRMAFLIVDDACRPIDGATVDIWHTAATGQYSGAEAPDGCTLGSAEARASRWFRGVQTTNAEGRVDFNTCFPGWYPGRTVHIHITVRINNMAYVTTQLYFDDALTDEIVATQPIYSDRGARDTNNASDGFISTAAAPDYSFQTERQADGAMLAWKAVVIRASTATPLCVTPG